MSKRLVFQISIFLSIIFGMFYWIYHYYLIEEREIIIIYPDPSHTKVKPEQSGGTIIANTQNTIYENLQKKKIRKQITLQPEPEKPLNINSVKTLSNNEIESIDNIISEIENIDKTINNPLDMKEEVKLEIGQGITPKSSTQEKNLVGSEVYIANVNHPNPPKVGLNIVKVTEKREMISGEQLLNKKKPNYYKIQLASVKTEAVANQEMERIRKKYPKVFNKIPLFVRKMCSEKGNLFYAVMAGNYEEITQAKAICKKLDHYQECLITNR